MHVQQEILRKANNANSSAAQRTQNCETAARTAVCLSARPPVCPSICLSRCLSACVISMSTRTAHNEQSQSQSQSTQRANEAHMMRIVRQRQQQQQTKAKASRGSSGSRVNDSSEKALTRATCAAFSSASRRISLSPLLLLLLAAASLLRAYFCFCNEHSPCCSPGAPVRACVCVYE